MPRPRPAQPALTTTRPGVASRTPCEVARQLRMRAGERRAPAVADCVEGWVKGEVQEFRDGVTREIGEIRTGFDRFRRGVRDFGSKLIGAD